MCIAIPGTLIEREDGVGKVDIRGNILPVELGIVKAKIGDTLLVHAGCAIAVMDETEAEELKELLALVDIYGR